MEINVINTKTSENCYLGAMVAENTATVYGTTGNHTYEVGRMFYLAIPPDGYIQAADYLHQYVRPLNERVWVKLVIGKCWRLYSCND